MLGALRGEMANSLKLFQLMQGAGYPVREILDIYELFQDIKNFFEPVAFLNCDLAESGHSILEDIRLQLAKDVRHKILKHQPDALFILSWNYSVAALFATGIQKSCPTASKLYIDHESQNVLSPLYEPSSLLITESLLANKKAIESGILPWKLVLLPNHFPPGYEKVQPDRSYVEELIRRSGKKITLKKETVILGTVSRFEYRKNIEYALKVGKALYEQGEDILLVLKGDFEEHSAYPTYHEWLKGLMEEMKEEKWLLWDSSVSPFSEIVRCYASYDIFLHLSGSEAGSNVIVEALSLGVPSVILEGSTSPYLFREGAIFIKNDGTKPVDIARPFCIPCEKDLLEKVAPLVRNAKLRKEWSCRAREVAETRFSPKVSLERLPLILKAMTAYHHKSAACDNLKKEIEELYQKDLVRYGI